MLVNILIFTSFKGQILSYTFNETNMSFTLRISSLSDLLFSINQTYHRSSAVNFLKWHIYCYWRNHVFLFMKIVSSFICTKGMQTDLNSHPILIRFEPKSNLNRIPNDYFGRWLGSNCSYSDQIGHKSLKI